MAAIDQVVITRRASNTVLMIVTAIIEIMTAVIAASVDTMIIEENGGVETKARLTGNPETSQDGTTVGRLPTGKSTQELPSMESRST